LMDCPANPQIDCSFQDVKSEWSVIPGKSLARWKFCLEHWLST